MSRRKGGSRAKRESRQALFRRRCNGPLLRPFRGLRGLFARQFPIARVEVVNYPAAADAASVTFSRLRVGRQRIHQPAQEVSVCVSRFHTHSIG